MDDLGLRSALPNAPAAFLDSTLCSKSMVQGLLGDSMIIRTHIDDSVSAIAIVASRLNWQNLDDFDVALHQRALSGSIDEASHQQLIASAPTTRSHVWPSPLVSPVPMIG